VFTTPAGKYCLAAPTMVSVILVVPVEVSVGLVVPVEVSGSSRLGNAPGSSFPGVTPGDWLVACLEVLS